MLDWLWVIPALPLAGFVLLVGLRGLPRPVIALIGVGSVGASAALALLAAVRYLSAAGPVVPIRQVLWTWLPLTSFHPTIGLHLDPLSLLMMVVVTFVAFWIHLYSTGYMACDGGYGRFFAYMNLFVGAMLVLVLADNLLLLYLGWEGVGLCSYLLIGFWYTDPANGRAAMKAFIVTRVGDAALAVGLLLLYWHFGTLDIQSIALQAPHVWVSGSGLAIAAAALLLGGAVGKSAQLPLQTWLPDAMAGPTPVSALIHAATMVTAGVYLIARMNAIFELALPVGQVVAVIGAVTLLLAACSALTQTDIKRILAYSTISQIGYMFLALGVGAYSAAMFHFMTHAFFKSLLFLAAGAIILGMHHEQNIFKMGGLWRRMPLTFVTFLAGALSLAALPFVTAGFYSKDLILYETLASQRGSPVLWACGLVGAVLTALYTFRLVFVVFFGPARREPQRGGSARGTAALGCGSFQAQKPEPPAPTHISWTMTLPLVVLAVFAIVAGAVELPKNVYQVTLLSDWLGVVLPAAPQREHLPSLAKVQIIAGAASLAGIVAAWLLYRRFPSAVRVLRLVRPWRQVYRLWQGGWGFDWLYRRLVVEPFVYLARANRRDFIDLFYGAIGESAKLLHAVLSWGQTGKVGWYAACLVIGAIVLITILVLT